MATPVKAENVSAAVDGQPARTSLFWSGVWQKLRQWEDWSRGYLEKKYGRRVADGADVDDNPEIQLIEETLAGRSFDEMTGLERLRCINFQKHGYEAVEWELTKRALIATGLSGFLVGGMLGQNRTQKRFEKYAVGRDFGNFRNALRRKMDYTILMFAKNGLFSALRIGLIGGFSVCTVLHVSAYRNKYCSYYSPLACGTLSALMMARGGATGLATGFGFGVIPGMGLSALIIGFSYYNGLTANQGYWHMREQLSAELRERREHEEKVRRLMRDKNIWLKPIAERRLLEIEEAERKALEELQTGESPESKETSELESFSDGEDVKESDEKWKK